MAKQLKDKEYRLSFNLITELGIDKCRGSEKGCKDSLRNSSDKYKLWTSKVVKAIRETDGKNVGRILIPETHQEKRENTSTRSTK